MTPEDKAEYKEYKADAKRDGIFLISRVRPFGFGTLGSSYKGVTIAYQEVLPGNGKMVAVAVSYCSSDDEFKKKKGKLEVLRKAYGGEFVQLPLAVFLREDKQDFENLLLDIFMV